MSQLTLVEHALCPLDPQMSLVKNLIHETSFYFMDPSRHLKQAQARVISPSGLSASDEFYLWGLLALTFAQPESDGNLFASPHYCLRQLGVIDQHARRGGQQYQQFAKAIERLSQVTYINDQFYDPIRAEHRKVSFGFLSYSLPVDPQSSRAWRIAWDPIFFDIVRAAGGSFRFDLSLYRELDPASRRLFLILSKIFARRPTTPRFDVRHLAVNVVGFSPSVDTRNLKLKLLRCFERLEELMVVKPFDRNKVFEKKARGEYAVLLERGPYFERRSAPADTVKPPSALDDLLGQLGFEPQVIGWLLRAFPRALLREWVDITLAARERFGPTFFKNSPQAYLVDNLKHAVKGKRTPPDWWHDLRREEARRKAKAASSASSKVETKTENLSEEVRATYEEIAQKMFSVFRASGQAEPVAKANAEKFAAEYAQKHKLPLGCLFE